MFPGAWYHCDIMYSSVLVQNLFRINPRPWMASLCMMVALPSVNVFFLPRIDWLLLIRANEGFHIERI